MKNADEPAYPIMEKRKDDGYEYEIFWPGMTIRQRFAMAAMQGILSDANTADTIFMVAKRGNKSQEKLLAAIAITYADALLKELEADHD